MTEKLPQLLSGIGIPLTNADHARLFAAAMHSRAAAMKLLGEMSETEVKTIDHWLKKQPKAKRARLAKPVFDSEHPTDADKKLARKAMEARS